MENKPTDPTDEIKRGLDEAVTNGTLSAEEAQQCYEAYLSTYAGHIAIKSIDNNDSI